MHLRKYTHPVKEADVINSIAHSFSNIKISTYYMPGTVLNTKDI